MYFELYSRDDALTAETWRNVIQRMLKRLAYFESFTITVAIEAGQVTFFLESDKDFVKFGNEILPFLPKQVTTIPGKESVAKRKFAFVDFSDKENFIRLKEREQLRKNRSLDRIRWTFHRTPFFPHHSTLELFFSNARGKQYCSRRRYFRSRFSLVDVDFSQLVQYKKKAVPIYVKLQRVLPAFSSQANEGFLEVLGFPYISEPRFLPLSRVDFHKHSLIVGQTGTGKSKFIESYIKELAIQGITRDYSVVILDPHASLYTDFSGFPNAVNIDFIRSACRPFAQIGEPSIAAELTILLFKTLIGDEQFNARLERVLKYALFVLFKTNHMSFESLRLLLTDIGYRKELLLEENIPVAIRQFFDTDFVEIQTKYHETGIMPMLTLMDDTLLDLITNNQLVFLSLNQITLGQKATKLLAGLLIQQLFLLAQSRALPKPVLFFIDEVSVVQNAALAAILSEARKFNLALALSQQYLHQVDEPIRNSIVTNVSNYVIFKISEDDAVHLANNLEFDFPDELLNEKYQNKGVKELELKLKMMTTLNPRECIARFSHDNTLMPVFKARTKDI